MAALVLSVYLVSVSVVTVGRVVDTRNEWCTRRFSMRKCYYFVMGGESVPWWSCCRTMCWRNGEGTVIPLAACGTVELNGKLETLMFGHLAMAIAIRSVLTFPRLVSAIAVLLMSSVPVLGPKAVLLCLLLVLIEMIVLPLESTLYRFGLLFMPNMTLCLIAVLILARDGLMTTGLTTDVLGSGEVVVEAALIVGSSVELLELSEE